MRLSGLIISLILVAGCGQRLRPDPVPSAIDSRYPTAELIIAGKRKLGLAILEVRKGSDLETVELAVQGYASGTVRATSDACGLNHSVRYDASQVVALPLRGRATVPCVIAVTVSPEYPKQEKQSIVVEGFRGYVAIVPSDGSDSILATRKVAGQWASNLWAFVGGQGKVRVVLEGCGKHFDQELELDAKEGVGIPLASAVANESARPCILTGMVISPVFRDLLVRVLVEEFDSAFTPLPIPVVSEGASWIEVKADPAVSLIVLEQGGEIRVAFDQTTKFKAVDLDKPLSLRLVTVAGRVVLGERGPDRFEVLRASRTFPVTFKGSWAWQN